MHFIFPSKKKVIQSVKNNNQVPPGSDLICLEQFQHLFQVQVQELVGGDQPLEVLPHQLEGAFAGIGQVQLAGGHEQIHHVLEVIGGHLE